MANTPFTSIKNGVVTKGKAWDSGTAFKPPTPGNVGLTPTNTTPSVTPTYNYQVPVFNGLSASDFERALMDKAKSEVDVAKNNQINLINKNLQDILYNLDTEKSKIEPMYQDTIENIKNNTFRSQSDARELMNMSGWNPQNSGLAIGEMDRIKIAGDKELAKTERDKAMSLEDIARRINMAKTNASNDTANVQQNAILQLLGVGADAMLKSDERNYNMFTNDRAFNYGVSRDKVQDFKDDRTYNRGVLESDRAYKRGVLESDRNYDRSVLESDRTYNYQVSRDQVLDQRFMDQFDYQKKRDIIEDAFKNKQINISERNAALQAAEFAWQKDPSNPDNKYKEEMILKSQWERDNADTLGVFYTDMVNSPDPQAWLKERAKYLTNDELKSLLSMMDKNSGNDSLQLIAEELLKNRK